MDIKKVSRVNNAVKIEFSLTSENPKKKNQKFYLKLYLYHKNKKERQLAHFYLENTGSKFITVGTHTILWNFAMEKIALNGDYHFGIVLIPKSRKYLGWVISGLGITALTTYFLISDPETSGEEEEKSKILPPFDQTP